MTAGTVIVRCTSKGHIGSEFAALIAHSGQFNHCMLIDGCWFHEAVPRYGVRAVPEAVAMRGVARYQDRIVTVPHIDRMRDFLADQRGAGYDYPGALGLPFLRAADWQDPARWWCWELVIAALGAGGLWLVDPEKASSGTPNDVYRYDAPTSPIFNLKAA